MKKLFTYMVLAAVPFCASAANDKCAPNLTKQDMCIFAKKLADEFQKELPIKVSDNILLTEVKTENTRVIITGAMKVTSYQFERNLNNNHTNIDKVKDILRSNAKESVCLNKQLTSFINLGGVIQYEYVFSDGKLLDVTAVTSCK
ncbi:hypothetical protein [Serratia fonticola]|uniref:hypothetical protein n=1 Tax=Serratia fonticola TaxID=47917 RepID=UPI003AABD08A|nr:hypothetical protein [Serratia fonticola]